ncbi:MAG TPA: hypothetical protein VFC07_02655, partial [Verrucomicrobiae bacterium]|nr:hypothetical protein [Verrucomicrobiae bacterium]
MPKGKLKSKTELFPVDAPGHKLRVTLDYAGGGIRLQWTDRKTRAVVAELLIDCPKQDVLAWKLSHGGHTETEHGSSHRKSIRSRLESLQRQLPVDPEEISAGEIFPEPVPGSEKAGAFVPIDLAWEAPPWIWLENEIVRMVGGVQTMFSGPGEFIEEVDPILSGRFEKETRRIEKQTQEREARMARVRESQKRMEQERRQRELARRTRAAMQAKTKAPIPVVPAGAPPRMPVPPVPLSVKLPPMQFQDTHLALHDLGSYFLRERAALWWVSNQ